MFDTVYSYAGGKSTSSISDVSTHGMLWNLQQRFSLPVLASILPKQVPIDLVVGEIVKSDDVDASHELNMDAVQIIYEKLGFISSCTLAMQHD
jgi:hypothetical protein